MERSAAPSIPRRALRRLGRLIVLAPVVAAPCLAASASAGSDIEVSAATGLGRHISGAGNWSPVLGARLEVRLESSWWHLTGQAEVLSGLEQGVDALGVTSRWFALGMGGGVHHTLAALRTVRLGVEASTGPLLQVQQTTIRVGARRRHHAAFTPQWRIEAGIVLTLGVKQHIVLRLRPALDLPAADPLFLWLSCGWNWQAFVE